MLRLPRLLASLILSLVCARRGRPKRKAKDAKAKAAKAKAAKAKKSKKKAKKAKVDDRTNEEIVADVEIMAVCKHSNTKLNKKSAELWQLPLYAPGATMPLVGAEAMEHLTDPQKLHAALMASLAKIKEARADGTASSSCPFVNELIDGCAFTARIAPDSVSDHRAPRYRCFAQLTLPLPLPYTRRSLYSLLRQRKSATLDITADNLLRAWHEMLRRFDEQRESTVSFPFGLYGESFWDGACIVLQPSTKKRKAPKGVSAEHADIVVLVRAPISARKGGALQIGTSSSVPGGFTKTVGGQMTVSCTESDIAKRLYSFIAGTYAHAGLYCFTESALYFAHSSAATFDPSDMVAGGDGMTDASIGAKLRDVCKGKKKQHVHAALALDPCANTMRNAPPSQQDLETPGRFGKQACSVAKISQLVSEQDVNQERETATYVNRVAALSNFHFNHAHKAMFVKLLRVKVGGGHGIQQLVRVVGSLDVLDADGLDELLRPGITIPNWSALRLAYSSTELRRTIPDLVRKDAAASAAAASDAPPRASGIVNALMRLGDAVEHHNGPPVSTSAPPSAPPSAAIAPPSAVHGPSSSQDISSDDDVMEVHYRAKKSVSGKERPSQFTTYQTGKIFRSATDGDAKRRAMYPPKKWCFVVSDANVFGYIKRSHLKEVVCEKSDGE